MNYQRLYNSTISSTAHHYPVQSSISESQQRMQLQYDQGQPVTSPTCWDVLNGRGQGVQRHPGNVKYRALVFSNKAMYAKCHKSDKTKISKGIVAAVRELGGRFLELDERTEIYKDIGDGKATEKTSQALREGQKDIREEIYKNGGFVGREPEKSAESYIDHSVQVLLSLRDAKDYGSNSSPPKAARQQSIPLVTPSSSSLNCMDADDTAMAWALDQFPQAHTELSCDLNGRHSFSSDRPSIVIRKRSGMSVASISSDDVRHMLQSALGEKNTPGARKDRDTCQSILSMEIKAMIQQSEHQHVQVEDTMAVDDWNSYEDEEVFLSDEDGLEDRVSELGMRFTDMSADCVPESWT